MLASMLAQAQDGKSPLYERAYRFEKTVANGTSAYTSGYTIGSVDSLDLTKLGALGTWVWLQNLAMVDSMKNDATYEMWVFSSRPATFIADNQPASLAWATAKTKIAVFPFGSAVYDGTYKSFAYDPQTNSMLALDGTTKVGRYLYYYLIIRSVKTWTVASELVFKVTLFR
jgi:hypothetical protein